MRINHYNENLITDMNMIFHSSQQSKIVFKELIQIDNRITN